MQDKSGENPVYVVDETDHQATPPGMLSRNELTKGGGAGVEKDVEQSMTRTYILAGALGIGVLILGCLGIFSVRQEINAMDQAGAAAHDAKPALPDDVQGVRVRKGMKHNPMAPPKTPGKTINDEKPVPLNAVPDGGPVPEDGTPPAGTAPADGTTAPAPAPAPAAAPPAPTEAASDVPSGDPE